MKSIIQNGKNAEKQIKNKLEDETEQKRNGQWYRMAKMQKSKYKPSQARA